MHFAFPPRKNSQPPPYAKRSSRIPALRRSRLQIIAVCALGIFAVAFFFSRITGGSERIPLGTPPVVIITVLDPDFYSAVYLANVKENRIEYARKHGYATFFANTTDYELMGAPGSWSRVPAVRHAMTRFPHSSYMWYLDQNALIMNPDVGVEDHIMNQLENLMIRDHSVVPPDSVIKTYSHLHGDEVDLVLTQDTQGLSQSSFILRRGEWAEFFIDTWFDPLYRSYNFQKADTHALEHIVQWHPTILTKLALIPQRTMNSYSMEGHADASGVYKDGDFVIRFEGCDFGGNRNCEREAEPFSKQWRTIFHAQR